MRIPALLLVAIFSGCLAQGNFSTRQENYNKRASAEEFQPDKVIETLDINKGWLIGDLGAGGGYYTFRLAEETGKSGKVFAADINKSFLQSIEKEAQERGLDNISIIQADEDDSNFDDQSLDLIFIRNTFHHFTDRNDYMKRLAKKIKKNGKIVLIDYKSKMAQYPGHSVSREDILSALENTGLTIDEEHDFIEKQFFFVLKLKQ